MSQSSLPFLTLGLCLVLLNHHIIAQEFDFRDHDFDLDPKVELDGKWFFYDNVLDTSELSEIATPELITVPGIWKKIGYKGTSYATYKTLIRASKNSQLGLLIPNSNGAYEVYINGQLAASKGKVGKDLSSSMAERKTNLIPLFAFGTHEYEIIWIISSHRHSRSGIDDSVVLGPYEKLRKDREFERAFDYFLSGSLIIGSFFFLGLFYFGREEKMALYFSLFCLCYAYRIIGWGSYPLHDFVNIPYFLSIRLEYATFYLSGFFFGLYVKNLFPEETPKLLVNIFVILSLAWACTVLLPARFFTQMNIPYLIVLLCGMLTITFIYVKAMINGRVGANYSVYATLVIIVVFGFKTLDYLKVLDEPMALSMIGQIIFFCFQSLILSRHFANTWKKAKETAERSNEELKSTQKQLIESEKMASIGVLTAGLAHEINNPLNIIGGVVDPIKDDLKELRDNYGKKEKSESSRELFNEIDELLDGISKGTNKAAQVIRNLLDITPKSDNKEIGLVHLKELVDSTLILIEKGNPRIRFHVDIAEDLMLYGNSVEINQVLLNIIKNSLDVIKDVENAEIKLNAFKNGEWIKLDISDNGRGMNKDIADNIFEPFYSTKKEGKGTGLGLYISKSIMIKHSGDIEVESEPGIGTTFTLKFPLPGDQHSDN